MAMKDLTERTRGFNRNRPAWIAEFSLNRREIIRAELLSEVSGDYSISLRRWVRPDGGSLEPTQKGLGCSVKHLPALAALLNEALHRARTLGLMPPDERATAPTVVVKEAPDV
jgi:hypothetical protein